MIQLPKKVELLISISIIVLSVFISAFLIHKYIIPSTNSYKPARPVDKQIALADVDWSEQRKTLIIALQASCRYCSESAPFYKHLIESVKSKNVKLIAVLPSDVKESRTHLDKLGLTSLEVKQASLDSIQVDGTPTLILVNNKGEIANYWVGKLPPDKEAEVIKTLISEG